MSWRIALVDDHAVLRRGLRMILEAQPDMHVVCEAGDGRSAVRSVEAHRPDLVLMDISMLELNGIAATAQIRERCPDVQVIILSMLATREHVYAALRAGAQGYVLKESLADEVIEAVRRVADGRRYLGDGVADLIAEDVSHLDPCNPTESPFQRLSLREMEVLQLLSEGRVPKEIASTLDISPKTVDTYRSRLMSKLGVHSLAALIKLAVRHNITTVDG